jgi:hypothetical protein
MAVMLVGPTPLVLRYNPGQSRCCDELAARSCNGTFPHSRRFISYQNDRFADRSVLLQDRHRRTVGVFEAAQDTRDPVTIASRPGLTYGGLVHTCRFLDFGISTTRDGKELDQRLHQFEVSFGVGAVSYDRYELDLG